MYPNENIYPIFIRNPVLAQDVLLPRLIQKRDELILKKEKFVKGFE